ncbi:MAG: chromate transporter [Gammaproteobacteria bacterium]|nr:chromate transporter [Gammaproteobacteria bacterium]
MIYLNLFIQFFLIGLFTFGGGYAMIPLIEDRTISLGWLTEEEFVDMIAISESTPGPVAVNMATFTGYKVAGIFGSVCTTLGVILPSFIIILLVATILTHFIENRYVKAVLHGFQAVVIGLLFSTALYLLYSNIVAIDSNSNFEILYKPIIIFAVVLVTSIIYKLIRKKNLSPYLLLIEGGLLGFIFLYLIK